MNKAEDVSERDEVILHEIRELIDKIDSKVSIKVVDSLQIYAQARLSSSPYIELTTGLLRDKRFDIDDIKVLAAHELGHIKFKKRIHGFNTVNLPSNHIAHNNCLLHMVF